MTSIVNTIKSWNCETHEFQ